MIEQTLSDIPSHSHEKWLCRVFVQRTEASRARGALCCMPLPHTRVPPAAARRDAPVADRNLAFRREITRDQAILQSNDPKLFESAEDPRARRPRT